MSHNVEPIDKKSAPIISIVIFIMLLVVGAIVLANQKHEQDGASADNTRHDQTQYSTEPLYQDESYGCMEANDPSTDKIINKLTDEANWPRAAQVDAFADPDNSALGYFGARIQTSTGTKIITFTGYAPKGTTSGWVMPLNEAAMELFAISTPAAGLSILAIFNGGSRCY